MESSILNTFLTLSAVVGLFGFILFLLKKYQKKRNPFGKGNFIQVLGRTSLQPKTSIFLVQAGSRTLLIGVTDSNINTLADLTDDANDDDINSNSLYNKVPNSILDNFKKNKISDISLQNDKSHTNNLNTLQLSSEDDTSFSAFLKSAFRKGMN